MDLIYRSKILVFLQGWTIILSLTKFRLTVARYLVIFSNYWWFSNFYMKHTVYIVALFVPSYIFFSFTFRYFSLGLFTFDTSILVYTLFPLFTFSWKFVFTLGVPFILCIENSSHWRGSCRQDFPIHCSTSNGENW